MEREKLQGRYGYIDIENMNYELKKIFIIWNNNLMY